MKYVIALATVGVAACTGPTSTQSGGNAALERAADASAADQAAGLAGSWFAQQRYGPTLSGPLHLRRLGDDLIAEVGGRRTKVTVDGARLTFRWPQGARFEGRRSSQGGLRGFWIQPPSRLDTNVFATPVDFEVTADGWTGQVYPQPDTATFRLLLKPEAGTVKAALINPERNLGIYQRLRRVTLDGRDVSLWGTFRDRAPEEVILRGMYFADEDVLHVRYPWRGGGYDFRREPPKASTGPKMPASTLLERPIALDDGWPTASLTSVGMDPAPLQKMLEQRVLPPVSDPFALRVHSMVIARRGRLVAEAYFRGYHRDLGHDSRSASKSVAALLAAAAMQAGVPLSWDTPVYSVFDVDPAVARERRGITLRHLVHMNSGLDCDDNDPKSAANEGTLWDNATKLDFYQHTLGVSVVRPPGKVAVYCSASSNLAGGVVARVAQEDLLPLLDRLLMRPLGIRRYAVSLPPDGHPYMGGGIRFRPRDFLKFPQLLLDDGQWRGRRIISAKDASRMKAPEVKIKDRDYGYLWWTNTYPFRGDEVQAQFMAGNGGQIAMVVPRLELVVAFNAGNYGYRTALEIQNDLIPNFVLTAVVD